MRALWYQYPALYEWSLRLLPGDSDAVFRTIAELVGTGRRVLDLGCGPGTLARYLLPGCTYEGWDLNPRFAAYAQRRGINVLVRDCLDSGPYPPVECIVISRLLHHLGSRDHELIQRTLAQARERVIIFEPTLEEEHHGLYGLVYRLRAWLGLEALLGDHDGVAAHGRPRSKAELVDFLAAEAPCQFIQPDNILFVLAVFDTQAGGSAA